MSGSSTLDDIVFLRPETKLEPLACGWYAWTHLTSPAQRAMNVAYRHVPLLQSFMQNPSIHVSASQDPTLFGGPFVHLSQDRVAEVKRLLEETLARCAPLIRFANDLKQLDEQLQKIARGHSLSEFYAQLPQSLAGLVEFFYDINHHPRLRLHEELLYDENLGSDSYEVMLSMVKEADRRFFMSTPRLASPDSLTLKMPLADSRLDLLASMRTNAGSLQEAMRVFAITAAQRPLFASFFTATPPSRNNPQYQGDGVRVRYFGHACVLLQTAETSILIDPMLAWDPGREDARLTFNDLPDYLDYVVLSHNHQDHCAPEMLLQLRHRIGRAIVPANNSGSITDPSMKLVLKQLGIHGVDVLTAFDTVEIPDGKITSLPFPGEHVDLDIYSRHGIHIELKGRKFAFLVDSDGWDPQLFRRIGRRIGNTLDALFIGMECHGAPLTWLYGPLLTKPITRRDDESRRLSGLDSERAWKVLNEFTTPRVFVYAMGQEPWLKYIMGLQYSPDSIQLKEVAAFLERCTQAGIAAENLYLSREMKF